MLSLLKGDCLDIMKTLPDKSIDCFVCDLPYGCLSAKPLVIPNTENAHRKACPPTDRVGCGWDVKIDLAQFWEQVKRLSRNDNTPVLMFCNTRFGAELIASNPKWFRYDLVWDKGHGVSFLLANKMPMKSHEMIYIFSKKGAYYKRIDVKTDKGEWKLTGKGADRTAVQYNIHQTDEGTREGGKDGMRCPLSVIPVGGRLAGGHPTQKPAELYKWLLERYCPEGGTMLDPTAGSFNSCFTAKEMGLKAIGIEKDLAFFWKGVSRL